jgi:hypothetical protein
MIIPNQPGKHAITIAEKIVADAQKRTLYKLSCMDDKEFKQFVIRGIECKEIILLGDLFGIEAELTKVALSKI